jgi:hypothetical protein
LFSGSRKVFFSIMKMLRMPTAGALLYALALYGVNVALGWSPVETIYLVISSAFMFFALFAYEIAKAFNSQNSNQNHSGRP